MNEYETKMVKAFKLQNYKGSNFEKIALRDLAGEMSIASDYTFGEAGESKDNFSTTYNYLLGLSYEDLTKDGSALIPKLFQISLDTLRTYGSARAWYESNKEEFDEAYQAVLDYIKENNPEMLPRTR